VIDILLIGQKVVFIGGKDVVPVEDTEHTLLSYSLSQNFLNPFNLENGYRFKSSPKKKNRSKQRVSLINKHGKVNNIHFNFTKSYPQNKTKVKN